MSAASAFLDFTLKTASNLRTKGDDKAALEFLHDVLVGKKKAQVLEYEQIMLQYIHVAVDLLAIDRLREALSAYRNHIQHFSPGSFQVIIETLLTHANEKVQSPKSSDLAAAALLASVENGEEEHAHKHLSFLWDVYGVLLDLIKTNGKLVSLYIYTVTSALQFCERNGLKTECVKLGQALHTHLQGASKMTEQRSEGSQTLSYAIDLVEPETALALIQVRLTAMETMMNMRLMAAAMQQAEAIASFRLYIGAIPMAEEVRLWSLLAAWFFSTGNLLLHAYLQQHLYWVTLKYSKSATVAKLADMRNLAVVSTLAASTYSPKDLSRLMPLLKLGIVPKRHLLLGQCRSRGLLESVHATVSTLYSLLEEQYAPLTLVDSVRSTAQALSPELQAYVPFLHSVAEEVALKQLSGLYRTISFSAFIAALKLQSQAEAEARLLKAALNGAVAAKIDHKRGLIEFPQGEGLSGFCWKLSQVSELLEQFQATVSPNRSAATSMKEVLQSARESRQTAEKLELAEKVRKENVLKLQEEEEQSRRRELESRQKAEASTADLRKKLDMEQRKQKLSVQRRQLYLEEIEYWVEKMRKEGFSGKEMKIKGKKVKDMTDEEKLECGFEEFVALHKKLFEAARSTREEQMQQASRQLQYRERAKREVEAAALQKQWESEQDSEVQKVSEQHQLNYERDLALKKSFTVAVPFKAAFMQTEADKARVPFTEQYDAWLKSQVDSLSQSILQVAKELREEERKKQKELKRLETAKSMEQEVRVKQEEAKRKLFEESRIKMKESREEWQTVKTPASATRRFINSKKEEEVKTPAAPKEEVKRAEPASLLTSQSVRWTRPETVAQKPVEAKPSEVAPPAGGASYRSRFKNSAK